MDTSIALQRLGRDRDPEAWRAILDAHGMAILNLARRITGDAALAEDVCQETLLQVRADAARYRPMGEPAEVEASARGWIMRIACHTASKMLRRRENARRREARAVARGAPSVASAADVALSREEAELVRHEVAALSEPHREAVCLHFYAGLPYAELAASLTCSVEAAKKRVQRGLERLRSRLGSRGLVIGIGVLTAQLSGGVAEAAETAATTATAVALDAQRQAVWQALLNSSQQPVFSCAAQLGGAALMSKTTLAASAAVLFCLTSLSAYYISSAKVDAQQAQTTALQQNVEELQQQLAATQEQLGALRTDLADRQDENLTLKMQVAKTQDELASLKEERGNGAGFAFQTDGKMPPEIAKMVNGILKNAEVNVDVNEVIELDEIAPDAEPADPRKDNETDATDADEEAKKGFKIRRFKLPGGGEGKIMTKTMVLGTDGELLKKMKEGNVKIQQFDMGNGEGKGQVIIRMHGGPKEPKSQEPPKVKDDF